MSVVVYPNVRWGGDHEIGEFCVIGVPPRGKTPGELETRIGENAMIRSHTVIYAGNIIGARFSTGHAAMIREQNEIGDDVSVGTHAIIEHHVEIHSGVRIHSGVFIPEFSILEAGCWIGPNVVLTNARYPLSKNAKKNLQGPHVLAGAKIGANATVLPGVVIGRDALVGAGAVVAKDVPDGVIAAGVPAVAIGSVERLPDYSR